MHGIVRETTRQVSGTAGEALRDRAADVRIFDEQAQVVRSYVVAVPVMTAVVVRTAGWRQFERERNRILDAQRELEPTT
jgi:hypothetical protein